MGIENKQFELPLEELKIDNDEIKLIALNLKQEKALQTAECEVTKLENSKIQVSIRAAGVTSTFVVDTYTLSIKLDEDKSYDVFAGDTDYNDLSSRPIKDTESVHKERKNSLKFVLEELADPSLIED